MHHLYPTVKGDPLCPLGFHPQVRWPTRCKRCFRDYKEHGNKRKEDEDDSIRRSTTSSNLRRDDVTISSPTLSTWNSSLSSRTRDNFYSSDNVDNTRNWASSTSLSTVQDDYKESTRRVSGNTTSDHSNSIIDSSGSSGGGVTSWTSTPDLSHLNNNVTSTGSSASNHVNYNLPLPKKRTIIQQSSLDSQPKIDTGQQNENKVTLIRPDLVIKKTDSLAERVKKMQAQKNATTNTTSKSQTTKTSTTKPEPAKTRKEEQSKPELPKPTTKTREELDKEQTSNDVQFLIQVKSKTTLNKSSEDTTDTISIADTDITDRTDTTLVGNNELTEQIESLKKELEQMKQKCERIEREKSDLLLRKIANNATTDRTSRAYKSNQTDLLKLQQKVNELQTLNEDLQDDKKSLQLKVKELESELTEAKQNKQLVQELQTKLTAAEQLCEELMDENEDMKKEMRDLEEEIEEMQDNFREDQADEYTSLKKELEQTSKNCRILSFKLRKSERKIDELETIKNELETKLQNSGGVSPTATSNIERIKQLENELNKSNDQVTQLKEQLLSTNDKLLKLEATSTKKKPPMLGNIGKSASSGAVDGTVPTVKISRESLIRGNSQDDPAQLARDLQDSIEREADLREQLKFAEEEAQNLRRKTSRIEDDNESLVLQLKKMATKARSRKLSPTPRLSPESSIDKDEGISDIEDPTELKLLLELNEQEAAVLRRKVEDLEVENEMLNKKVKELHEKKYKSPMTTTTTTATSADKKQIKMLEQELSELKKKLADKQKSSSSDDTDKTTVNLKRQLELMEQETQILHGKIKTLEHDHDELLKENKRLQLLSATSKKPTTAATSDKDNNVLTALKTNKLKNENDQLKEQIKTIETEKNQLNEQLTQLKTLSIKQMKSKRTPKIPTDLTTKLQLKKMVIDLENEISDLFIKFKYLEDDQNKNQSSNKNNNNIDEYNQLKLLNEQLNKDLENNKKQYTADINKLNEQIKQLNLDIKKYEDYDKLSNELKTIKKDIQTKDKEILQLKKQIDEKSKSESDKLLQLNKTVDEKTKQITKLEKQLQETKDQIATQEKTISSKNTELSKLEKQQNSYSSNQQELTKTKEQVESMKKSKETIEKDLNQLKKDVTVYQTKNKDLENDVKALNDQNSKLKEKYEKELKLKESEIKRLELKLKTTPADSKFTKSQPGVDANKLKEYEEQINKLKAEINIDKQEYEDLTRKYELLEEEHVVVKAELVIEKENINRQLQETEMSLNELNELNMKYLLDIQQLQTKIKEMEAQNQDGQLIDMLNDQITTIRRENDVLKQKLDDYNKVDKIQLNINTDNTILNLEKDIRQLQNKLQNQEKIHKIELNESKMRYDKQLTIVNDELQQLQIQMKHFKRERDHYKDMLNELNNKNKLTKQTDSNKNDNSINNNDKFIQLQQHIHYLEDQLSESSLETSKLKTELLAERSQWEIKLSELKTRCNELEEDRILTSGRSKIPGQRTRMELAWQKEREEQQRLLQETSTLARDLRQTLFEVERERDKERLEFKRKQEQFQKFIDDENDDNKKKLVEIQCDLLELRDAHAKLRTTNEKLRREKDKYEREFNDIRILLHTKKRNDFEEDKKLSVLLEYVDDLIHVLSGQGDAKDDDTNSLLAMTPTAPRRYKSKSRESSPAPPSDSDKLNASRSTRSQSKEPSPAPSTTATQFKSNSNRIQLTVNRLIEATNELRKYQRLDRELDRDHSNKRSSMRRAASIETDNTSTSITSNNLNRRSISLSGHNNSSMSNQEGPVWKTRSIDDDNSLSSIQSLEASGGVNVNSNYLDSRLSGGSTQSDIINTGNVKKKKGLIGKLKKLTKSHSIDDSTNIDYHQSHLMVSSSSTVSQQHHQGSDSDVSLSDFEKTKSKKDLRGRITGIFKRSGSSSRSNSLERNIKKDQAPGDTSSLQRPLIQTTTTSSSNTSIQSKNDDSQSKSKYNSKGVVQGVTSGAKYTVKSTKK